MLLINLKQEYMYLTVFIVISFILSVFLLLLSYTVSYKKKNDVEKLSAYECGFDPFGTGVSSFEVHFYIIGILFIIFDIEIIFLYPWALRVGVLGGAGFCVVITFLGILTVGFVYEWQKGALDWSKGTAEKPSNLEGVDLVSPAVESIPPKAEVLPPKLELCLSRIEFFCNQRFNYYPSGRAWVWHYCLGLAFFKYSFHFFAARIFIDVSFLTTILILLVYSATKSWFGKKQPILLKHQNLSYCLMLGLFVFGYFLVWPESRYPDVTFYYQQYAIRDFYSIRVKFFLVYFTYLFLYLTLEYLLQYSLLNRINLIEFPLVICFSLFFMLLLISSFNLFGAYTCLEGVTFALYILAGMNYKSQNSLEAGVKYFCLGALSSGFLLFGIALIFIMTKTLDFSELRVIFGSIKELPLLLSFALIFVFFGFWFKLSIFPCHAWTPDVYEGVLTPVTFFFATIVKLSVFSFLVRVLFFLLGTKAFLFFWQPLFLFVATGSIVFGALGALAQTKIKRFIGYTSINQMGYLFIGISSGDLLGLQVSFLYLFFYLIMSFVFFSVLLYINDCNTGKDILFINQLSVFGHKHRNLSVILALVLFSMAGIPPLAGFFGKFFLFFSAFKAGNHSLIFLGLFMNTISAFYYLRIIKCIFFDGVDSEVGPKYRFFIGFSRYWPVAFDLILGSLFCFLILSPFFLNSLLFFFDQLSFSAFYLHTTPS